MRSSGTSQSGRARPGPKYLGALAIALLGILILTTACGGGGSAAAGGDAAPTTAADAPAEGGSPTPSSTDGPPDGAGGEPSAIAFAACMRANGVPNFPDPQPSGGIRIDGTVASNPNFQPALQACAHLRPEGGQNTAGGTVEPEVLLAFAQCMRDNGVPDFPDLVGGGGMASAGPSAIDPRSPAFQSALEICGPEHGITINIRQ